MRENNLKNFLFLTASIAVACGIFYVCFRYVLRWIFPFLLALGIASFCEPIVVFLQKKLRFQRGFAAALLTVFILFLLGGLLSLLGTTLLNEAKALLEGIPMLLHSAPAMLEQLLTRFRDSSPLLPDWLLSSLRSWLMNTFSDAEALFSALAGKLLAALTDVASALPRAVLSVAVTVLAVFFTISAYPTLRSYGQEHLPVAAQEKLYLLRGGVMRSLAQWFKAELSMLCITFCELLLGFLLLYQPYALLLALLIALLDALPVFGTGAVLVPWALWLMIQNKLPRALAFFALYLTTLLVRNILEPKLIASRAGIPSVVSLFAMYLGFCTFGISGMVLFPLILLLSVQVIQTNRKAQGRS